MTIDPQMEAEYDNRARVPEAPAIIAGWARDANAFRAGHPPQIIPYGHSERQRIDLFAPGTREAGRIVMFIHGGYWRALDPSLFSHMARGLLAHGITVAVPGYDLCPGVRLDEIVNQMRAACLQLARLGRKLVVAGHSAGGHLAACMLATDWRAVSGDSHGAPVEAAYAISGLFDLAPLVATSINDALRLDAASAERLSPLTWAPPAGLTLDAAVGMEESAEFVRQSRTIVEKWGAAAVRTRFVPVEGANHFTAIAPLADPGSAMTRRLAELARAP